VQAPRRLIVEVRSGPLTGTKAVVAPGDRIRVGRTDRADLAVERDPEISGLHFEIAWDGETAMLRDLGSARGTVLAGAPLEGEAPVAHGSWIKAGETTFSIYFEAYSPRRGPPADPALAARALATLAPRVGRLHAVLDAARDERVLELCRESVDETRSLYEGVKGDALASEAPYLVRFDPGSDLLSRLLFDGWGRSFGVFLESRASFKALRRHLRRFLIVTEDASGARLYFRYYDPRVLREIVPLFTVRQADEVYGDVIDAFLTEDGDGDLASFPSPHRALEVHDAPHP
jgi:hypothetical protein